MAEVKLLSQKEWGESFLHQRTSRCIISENGNCGLAIRLIRRAGASPRPTLDLLWLHNTQFIYRKEAFPWQLNLN